MGNDACRNSRGRAGASEVKSYQTDAETKQVWGVVYIFLPADYSAGNINNEVYVMITDKDISMKYIKEAMKLIENLTGNGKRSSERVFSDFLILSACSYSNFFDSRFREEREQRYLEIIKGYEKKEIAVFSEILAAISNAAISYWNRGEIKDILGYLYTKGQYYKKSLGQFFTPEHVAYFMARITGSDYKDLLKKREFISISEQRCLGLIQFKGRYA